MVKCDYEEAKLPPYQQIVHIIACERAQEGINPLDCKNEILHLADQINKIAMLQ